MTYKLPLLIYDSECSLCTRFVKGIQLVDQKNQVHFVSLHDESLYLEFPELSFEACHKEVHLITPEKTVRGSEVIEYLVKLIPAVKKFTWLIESNAARKASYVFYRKLDSMRTKLQGCKKC